MTCYGWKGGIGTASRAVPTGAEPYLVGALVLANFGRARDLRIAGVPVGESLRPPAGPPPAQDGGGSCVVVLATSAPADARQLGRLARRVQNGLAWTGTFGEHGSGEYVIAFSTARHVPHVPPAAHALPGGAPPAAQALPEDGPLIDVMFRAVAEATEEAVVNALLAAGPVADDGGTGSGSTGGTGSSGTAGGIVPLPVSQLAACLSEYRPRPLR
jgi:D-aminopeptidase